MVSIGVVLFIQTRQPKLGMPWPLWPEIKSLKIDKRRFEWAFLLDHKCNLRVALGNARRTIDRYGVGARRCSALRLCGSGAAATARQNDGRPPPLAGTATARWRTVSDGILWKAQ